MKCVTALVHLYDFAYLQNHPLAIRLARDARSDNVTRAQQFRRLLLDAIERLRPQTQPDSDTARAYAVLTYRCVDNLSIEEIEAKLGLSRRQIYREYARGVDAVAGQLWDELNRLAAHERARKRRCDRRQAMRRFATSTGQSRIGTAEQGGEL